MMLKRPIWSVGRLAGWLARAHMERAAPGWLCGSDSKHALNAGMAAWYRARSVRSLEIVWVLRRRLDERAWKFRTGGAKFALADR